MTNDPILHGTAHLKKKPFDWVGLACLLGLIVLSVVMFTRQTIYGETDFCVHMGMADYIDFRDLHTITSRGAYPMWHIMVAFVHLLGAPIEAAAIGVTAFVKALAYVLTYAILVGLTRDSVKRWIIALASLAVVTVTGVLIMSVSPFVYKGVGSPNVWHNPTQLSVTVAILMVMPWLAHCWYDFERKLAEGQTNVMLPWWKVIVLAVVCMGSLACKPTFMQALLPAAFVMFLVELIRHKTEWRYFGQIVLAFIPSVGYFLLQYLYYTGVVVAYTSGVEFGVTAQTAWLAVRNMLMMAACPLAAVIACWRKGMFKDRMLVLALLMILFSVLEAMAFRETGMREGHGNFTWASNSSAFFLWVVMMGTFLRTFKQDCKQGMPVLRKVGYAATGALFVWHLVATIWYLYVLINFERAF